MGFSRFYKFILGMSLSLTLVSSAWAADTLVQTLSEGSCWFEQGEVTKIASFNDGESLNMTRDEVELELEAS